MKYGINLICLIIAVLLLAPVYGEQPQISTEDVVLPAGYVIEPVLTGLTYPTSMAFGPDGSIYIAESGYSYGQHWAETRILKLRPDGRIMSVARGFRGPIMGITFHGNLLYVAHRGTISVVDLSEIRQSRRVRDIITGLPVVPNGQHFNGEVAFGSDGKMYFAVGAVTNSGIPGLDDYAFGWLLDFPWMHDAPAREVTLTGSNYRSPDLLGPDPLKFINGGAFLPFGTPSRAGQIIPAHAMPTDVVYRANPDGTGLEVYAWGIRSPFGFRFGPDGRLYMINQAMDDKGARAVANAPDTMLYIVRQNAWYGWPDYAGGLPVTDDRFDPIASRRPDFVIQNHPPVEQPIMRFEPHASDVKFDWSRSDRFGFIGEMFIAEFGDGSPLNTGLRRIPHRGFRIIRANTTEDTYQPFMTINNPGLETTRGPKRPIQPLFDPSGDNLYLLDFGVMTVRLSAEQIGINPLAQTGTLWRIRREDTPPAQFPAVGKIEGGRLISWWTVRPLILDIQKSIRVALINAQRGRDATDGLIRYYHRENARQLLVGISAGAEQALKRIDEPNVIDNGTRMLLFRVAGWATSPTMEPLNLQPNDPVIVEVNRWVERTAFPETEYLYRTYAVPGRWQRPLAKDVRP